MSVKRLFLRFFSFQHRRKYPNPLFCCLGLLLILCIPLQSTYAQCTGINGQVFTDFNLDGTFEGFPYEVGVEGVNVNVYDNNGTLMSSTTTDCEGLYNVDLSGAGTQAGADCSNIPNAPGNFCYRVEFSNYPKNYRVWAADANSYAETRFICDNGFGCTNVDLALYDKADYCETDNPLMVTSCYTNGDALGGGTTGADPAIVSFNYDGTNKADLSPQSATGSIWGIAHNKETGEVYLSSVMRRHSSFGPLGTGGIYTIDPNTGVVTNWLDVNTLPGVNTGVDSHVGLPADKLTPNNDQFAYGDVGKVSLGDIDVSESGDTLFVMNLNDQSLLLIDTDTKTLINQISFTDPANNPCGTGQGNPRPWAIEIHECEVYVGVTCDGGLVSHVMQLQPDGTFSSILEIDMSYDRNWVLLNDCPGVDDIDADWNNWSDNFNDAIGGTGAIGGADRSYPQPILSDIEVDIDGSLILGYIDRFGLQVGFANYQPFAGSTELEVVFTAGDILRACKEDCGDLVLEGTGAACPQLAQQDNPEFYQDDFAAFASGRCDAPNNYVAHDEQTFSGFATLAGSGTLVANGYDPTNNTDTGGTRWFNNETGQVEYGLDVLSGNVIEQGLDGKGVSLGDLEVLCSPPPIEIGNYIWYDADMDGQQDPCEPPLQNVPVEIYDAGGNLIGTATTDANGQYYFGGEGDVNLTGGSLAPDTNYEIRVPLNGVDGAMNNQNITEPGDTVIVTGTDSTADNIDNDGSFVENGANDYASFTFTTNNSGDNIHQYDFGFFTCPEITADINPMEICEGETFDITFNIPIDTVDYMISYNLAGSLLSDTDVYNQTGTTVLTTMTPNTGSTDTTLTGQIISNPSDTTQVYFLYVTYANIGDVPPDCPLPMDSAMLTIYPLPDIDNTAWDICDEDEDGTVDFDLSVADSLVNPSGSATVTYHNTLADASLGASPVASPYTTAGDTLYARIEGAGSCFLTSEVILSVSDCCPPLQCIPITVNKLDEE